MKRSMIAAAFTAYSLLAVPAFAANAVCEAQASEKKLAGAARNSYIKKCERDANAAATVSPHCAKSASDKKLAGAARTSHIKKCMADEAAATK